MKTVWLFIFSALAISVFVLWGRLALAQEDDVLLDSSMMFSDAWFGFDQEEQEGVIRRGGPWWFDREPLLRDRLELTDEQRDAMRELQFSLEKDMTRLHADLHIAQIELQEVMDQPSPRIEEARARTARVNEGRAAIFQRQIEFQVAIKNILTPEQQNLLQRERHGRIGRGPYFGPGMRRLGPGMGRNSVRPRLMPRWRYFPGPGRGPFFNR